MRAGVKSKGIRSSLVVFQFAVSTFLIIATVIVFQQLNYMQSMNLGMDQDNVIAVTGARRLGTNALAFKKAVSSIPGVSATSYTNNSFPYTAQIAKGTRALCLFTDSAGVVVGTDHGYLELDRQFRPLPLVDRVAGLQPLALPHPVVLSVLRASPSDLWLGTPAGLVHLTRENGTPKLTSIKEANGLGHDLVRCLHRDRSGGIWAGTGFGGVSKFTSDAFVYITEKDGLGSRIVSAIHRTADGLLWIGTQGGGLSHFDGTRIPHYEREDGLPSLFITCLGEDDVIGRCEAPAWTWRAASEGMPQLPAPGRRRLETDMKTT